MSEKKSSHQYKIILQNRRARFDYAFIETFEAGIMLLGSEVKSLRLGQGSLAEAHIGSMIIDGKEALYLFNCMIHEYTQANQMNHETKRPRKLLLRKREMNKILGNVRKKGLTVVPIHLYFNHKGIAKIHMALARGKKLVDKRETIKEREWKRSKDRILRGDY
jgi:SsrA-binding protein